MRAAWQELRGQPVKLALIVGVWATLLLGAYLLACHGLQFVYHTAGIFLVDRLWYLLLFVVLLMLMVSQLATAYSTLVRSPETAYWMSLPLDARWMGRAKWVESSCYSAWSVVLLLLPLGLAYVRVLGRSPAGVVWMVGLLLALVMIATSLATIALLAWLRWIGRLPAIRREWVPLGLFLACVVLFWLLGERAEESREELWFVALEELMPRVRLATSLWVPSAWMARSFSGWLSARWTEGWLFAALLWTTALVAARLLDRVAGAWLMTVLKRQASAVSGSGSAPARGLAAMRWWGHPFAACMVKDVRLLMRDPAQWGQGVVFFGLLGAYFANLHRMGWMVVDPAFRIGVSSLNLACTLLVFGSLAVRFLFPQMSLEGRRLWMVHVVPGGLRPLLHAKLLVYSLLALLLVGTLLGLSVARLRPPAPVAWWLAMAAGLTGPGLVGLTLGFGAQRIDVRATDPARIVSSSNGALALLLMLVHVGLVTWALGIFWNGWVHRDLVGMTAASVLVVATNAALGWWPIRRGLRALERLEL